MPTFYEWESDFELRFKSKPYEGVIPAALKRDMRKGKKWPIEKLHSLVSWMLESPRKEKLLYDLVLVSEYIAEKIGRCHAIKNKNYEYCRNHTELEKIRDAAVSFYEDMKDRDVLAARVAIGARMRASWMLHDYRDIADVMEDNEISQNHYAFVRNERKKMRNMPEHPPVMRLKNKQRGEYTPLN